MRTKAVSSTSKRAGAGAAPPRIRGKLFDALLKQADHERIVFIELNRAKSPMVDGMPTWAQHVDAEIEQAEKDGTTVPSAYVFVTNRGFVHALESERWTEIGLACGFKIADFASRKGAPSILDLAKARERHAEPHWLRKALHRHQAIPNTFDDRLAENSFAEDSPPRLLIGATYAIPDEKGAEVLGILTDGSGSNQKKRLMASIAFMMATTSSVSRLSRKRNCTPTSARPTRSSAPSKRFRRK